MNHPLWQFLADGLSHKAYISAAGTINKIPKIQLGSKVHKVILNILRAIDIHEEYLWDTIPETKVTPHKEYGYLIEQEYIPNARTIDILKESPKGLESFLDAWLQMQKDQKIVFDLLWIEGVIQTCVYHLNKSKFGKRKILPCVKKHQKVFGNLSKTLFGVNPQHIEKNLSLTSVIATNLLVTKEEELRFFDLERRNYRLRDPKNYVWWMLTEYILAERQKILNQ